MAISAEALPPSDFKHSLLERMFAYMSACCGVMQDMQDPVSPGEHPLLAVPCYGPCSTCWNYWYIVILTAGEPHLLREQSVLDLIVSDVTKDLLS